MKCSNEMLQNLPPVFFGAYFILCSLLMVYVDINQGIQNYQKTMWVFVHIPKIWHILKPFAGTFHQASVILLFLKKSGNLSEKWVEHKFSKLICFRFFWTNFADFSKFRCASLQNRNRLTDPSLLRKKVGQKIKKFKGSDTSKDELKNKAAELNAAKDELLEDFRTGFTKIPNEVIKGVTNREQNAIDKLDDVIQNLFEMKIK